MTGLGRCVSFLAVLTVAACGSTDATTELGSTGVETELRALYGDSGGEVRYFDGTADLNGDGRPEIVVHVAGPMVCGTGGCPTLVFTPGAGGYELVADISITRPPIQLSSRSANGWRNLLVRVGGGGLEGYVAELRFDGTAYPANPTVPPAERAPDTIGAETLIPDFESFTDGKLIPVR